MFECVGVDFFYLLCYRDRRSSVVVLFFYVLIVCAILCLAIRPAHSSVLLIMRKINLYM